MIRSVERLIRAAGCSLDGLRAAFQNEEAFRLEIIILIFVVPAGVWLGDDGVSRALLIGSWIFVMVVELINSAVEAAVDRIGAERHELSKRAKDLGAAAVLGAIVLFVVVWGFTLLGKL